MHTATAQARRSSGDTRSHGVLDASRWARSLGIATRFDVAQEALELAGGFEGGLTGETQERVAAVAMAILSRLKQLAFAPGGSPRLPITFVHRSSGPRSSVELAAYLENDGEEPLLVVSTSRSSK